MNSMGKMVKSHCVEPHSVAQTLNSVTPVRKSDLQVFLTNTEVLRLELQETESTQLCGMILIQQYTL